MATRRTESPLDVTIDIPSNQPKHGRVKLIDPIEKLIVFRHRLGLKQGQAAKRWKIQVRTLRSWESGQVKTPSGPALLLINAIIKAETAREEVKASPVPAKRPAKPKSKQKK